MNKNNNEIHDVIIKHMIEHIQAQEQQLYENLVGLSKQIKDLCKQCKHTHVKEIRDEIRNTQYYTCSMCGETKIVPFGDVHEQETKTTG